MIPVTFFVYMVYLTLLARPVITVITKSFDTRFFISELYWKHYLKNISTHKTAENG